MPQGPRGTDGTPPAGDESRAGHWRRAMVAALTWWVLATVAIALIADIGSSEHLGEAAGALLLPFLLGGVIAGTLARRSDRGWAWVRHFAVTLGAGMVFAILAAMARLTSGPSLDTGDTAAGTPSQAATAEVDAGDFLPELPGDLVYVDAPADVEREMRGQLVSSGAATIIDSLAVRGVERGSVPVGTVVAFKLNDRATSADEQGIVRGFEESAGTEGRPVDVGGVRATYLEVGEASVLLHIGDGVVSMVFGQQRSDIEPILAALFEGRGI